MPKTVSAAFDAFMSSTVNLEIEKTKTARASRDFLKTNIENLDDFFPIYNDKCIDFGSFARRTKIRPLDDIDIIFTLSANGCLWSEEDETVYIITPPDCPDYKDYLHENSDRLNSRKIINRFVSRLSSLWHYEKAELHRNKSAATLKLTSYGWNFDIVPAFFTREDSLGNTYYIIPDGNGNWIKTDPRLDRQRVTDVNQKHNGFVLDAIRAIKFWQRRTQMPRMSSYLIENIVLDYFDSLEEADQSIATNVMNILYYIQINICNVVNDPKKIQGDLNTLSQGDRSEIEKKTKGDYLTAAYAVHLEKNNAHKDAIQEWREIFGHDFPLYG